VALLSSQEFLKFLAVAAGSGRTGCGSLKPLRKEEAMKTLKIEKNSWPTAGLRERVIAYRTHYGQFYMAIGWHCQIGWTDGLAFDGLGFSGPYDGGKGYYADLNRVYHFFGEAAGEGEINDGTFVPEMDGDNVVINLIILFRERQYKIQFSMPVGCWQESCDPGDIFELHSHLDEMEVVKELTEAQLKAAAEVEKNFFASWGQGKGGFF
jgi:hypothetical protein